MIHSKFIPLLAVIFLLFSACAEPGSNSGNNTEPAKNDSVKTEQPVAEGKNLFTDKCASCHGGDGTAGILGAANLQQTTMDAAALQQIITNGKGNMPSFKTTFSEEEIKKLADYVQTLNPNPKTK
ncbi:MAG: cytochrome c [Bacteroidetes bacterium]|nr:cytochrome c [Bacteroidota bacterium]